MKRKAYSAGMVKQSFWFAEFRKVVQLLTAGHTMAEIKAMNLADNSFAAPTQARDTNLQHGITARAGSGPVVLRRIRQQQRIQTEASVARSRS